MQKKEGSRSGGNGRAESIDGGMEQMQVASNAQDGAVDQEERLRRLEESMREMDEQYTLQTQQQFQQQLDQMKKQHDTFRDKLLSLDL